MSDRGGGDKGERIASAARAPAYSHDRTVARFSFELAIEKTRRSSGKHTFSIIREHATNSSEVLTRAAMSWHAVSKAVKSCELMFILPRIVPWRCTNAMTLLSSAVLCGSRPKPFSIVDHVVAKTGS